MKNINNKEQVADSNGAQMRKDFLITGIQKIIIPLQDIVFTSNEKSDRLIITKAGMHSKIGYSND
jgi:hypothetical protein